MKDIGVTKVLIMLPYPEFKYKIFNCLKRNIKKCFISRDQFEEHRKEIVQMIKDVSKQYTNIQLVDPVPYICDEKLCKQVTMINNKETIIVFDNNHPSGPAAEYLGTQITDELEWLISPNG